MNTFLHLFPIIQIKLCKMKNILICFGFAALLGSCKNEAPAPETTATAPDSTVVKYTLTPFSPSKEFPEANLKYVAYSGGTFSASITGKGYTLGEQTTDAPEKNCANSKEGQHLHVIVDNEPYVAKYESSFPLEIPDGDHYLLCFLSRSYHESIKTTAASKAAKVVVANKSITKSEDISGPMLFYSRPKGLYTGDDTKKVMLDFYLVNATTPGYKVEADINGEKHMIDKWQPYYIEGLPEGDNTIKLTLLDSTGQAVTAPLNPVSRTFKIEKNPVSN